MFSQKQYNDFKQRKDVANRVVKDLTFLGYPLPKQLMRMVEREENAFNKYHAQFFKALIVFLIPLLSFSQVGIGTTNPTDTLDVNGTLRVRQLPTLTGNTVVADANGKLGIRTTPSVSFNPIQDSFVYNNARDTFWVTSTTGFFSENDIPGFTLSNSLSVTIPANSTRIVELNYNIPVVLGYSGANPAGYWGIGVLKNGVAFADACRKTNFQTVKPSPNNYYECYHVVGSSIETINNTSATPLVITYEFYLYIEQTQANYNYPVYVGRWALAQFNPNYNHGNGIGYIKVYEN